MSLVQGNEPFKGITVCLMLALACARGVSSSRGAVLMPSTQGKLRPGSLVSGCRARVCFPLAALQVGGPVAQRAGRCVRWRSVGGLL